jgi:hypothetical protein
MNVVLIERSFRNKRAFYAGWWEKVFSPRISCNAEALRLNIRSFGPLHVRTSPSVTAAKQAEIDMICFSPFAVALIETGGEIMIAFAVQWILSAVPMILKAECDPNLTTRVDQPHSEGPKTYQIHLREGPQSRKGAWQSPTASFNEVPELCKDLCAERDGQQR